MFAEADAKAHKVPGQEATRWEFNVVDHLEGFEAPIVGIMQNRFKAGTDIDQYLDRTEDNVLLEPIIDDILGERSREGLNNFAQDLDEMNAEALGFLQPKMTRASLPVRAMFLKGMPYVASDNEIPGDNAQAPAQWRGNDSQKEALKKAFTQKVSLVWGPAATGKSEVLANIIVEALRRNASERILVNAPRNVPVDSLLKRAVSVYESNNPRVQAPFVRLFSASQIQAQHAVKASVLNDPHHIENLRMAEASQNRPRWGAYGKNHAELIAEGFIEDEKKAKAYFKASFELTRIVMDKAKVVFCTTAACRNKALRWTVREENEVKLLTWKPTMNIVDEAACANPLELLLPLASFDTIKRAIYGGDHKQLPPFLVSDEAKKLWAKTFFEELVIRNWPTTLLNVQYRTHSDAAEAAYHVIYDDKVSAFHKTDVAPRPFYINFTGKLPAKFSAHGREWQLTTYLNFVDVAGGVQEGPDNGSKYNLREVEVVMSMLKTFLGFGANARGIAVVTGYTLQFEKIQEQLRGLHRTEPQKGWNQINLLTAGTVQAEEYNIVILSLVKTSGARGFLGERERANVVCTRHREAMYFVSALFNTNPPSSSRQIVAGARSQVWVDEPCDFEISSKN